MGVWSNFQLWSKENKSFRWKLSPRCSHVVHKLLPRFFEPIPEEIDAQSEALEKINIYFFSKDPLPAFIDKGRAYYLQRFGTRIAKLHGFHIPVRVMPPLHFRVASYIGFIASTGGCSSGGSSFSSPLFPAHTHVLASSCMALKICSSVLEDLWNTRLFLSFHISQAVSMVIERTPSLASLVPLLAMSAYHCPRSSVYVQCVGHRAAAEI